MSRKIIKDQRRQEILEALHRRLLIKPFDQTSIKEIAAEAGINHGMLHYYFKNKEDILSNYIDHVIATYKNLFTTWMKTRGCKTNGRPEDFFLLSFEFVTEKITMNRELSRIFIEIWEIANYNENIRGKLKETYLTWIGTASKFLSEEGVEEKKALTMGKVLVAFSEGLSMLSVFLDQDELEIKEMMPLFRRMVLSAIS
jgi:AcrR family transcriptional regulator